MSDTTPDNLHADQTAAPAVTSARPMWWRLLGIRRRQGKWLHVAPTLWGMFLIVICGGFAGMLALIEYSMQPEFCRSCHIMEPYYQAWHESTHSDVPCGDCHFEPGWRQTIKGKWRASSQLSSYLTSTYGSKPHAEVRDASCLREGCHERRLLEGKVDWTIKTQRGTDLTISFDHRPHLTELRRGKQLRCVSCHSQIVQGQHIVVTLDTCFLCHFKGLKHGRDDETLGGCRSCHDAPKEEIRLGTGIFLHADYIDRGVKCENCHADAISGDGAVPKQLCWTCHNQPQQIARYGDTSFLHQTHITDHKVECSSCHLPIIHHLNSAKTLDQGRSSVPDSHMAFDKQSCNDCHEQLHSGMRDLYRGIGGRGVPDMPSPMYRAQVDCNGCHQGQANTEDIAKVAGQTFIAMQEACDHCHGSRYSDRLVEWKAAIKALLQRAEEHWTQADDQISRTRLDDEQRLELRQLLDDAQHNITLVKYGRGVHNVSYATALLNVAIENCQQVRRSTADAGPKP